MQTYTAGSPPIREKIVDTETGIPAIGFAKWLSTISHDVDVITAANAAAATAAAEVESTAGAIAGTANVKQMTALRMREGFNAAGTAPVFACRAWVNFNGTGTVAIRASGNVSSITDNGAGDYTVNFTTALPDANYVATIAVGTAGNTMTSDIGVGAATAPTSAAFRFGTRNTSTGAFIDTTYVHCAFFR